MKLKVVAYELLARSARHGSLGRGRCRRDVDHFTRPGIMELFACFFLDSLGVGLELINLAGKLGVVLLQPANFLL